MLSQAEWKEIEDSDFSLAIYKQGLREGYSIFLTWLQDETEGALNDQDLASRVRAKIAKGTTCISKSQTA